MSCLGPVTPRFNATLSVPSCPSSALYFADVICSKLRGHLWGKLHPAQALSVGTTYHSPEATVLLLRESLTHVSQVGHATPVRAVEGAVVLLDALGHLLLIVLYLRELAACLNNKRCNQINSCHKFKHPSGFS